jgi:hypothetical protein
MLFITKQPFPKAVKQGTKASGPQEEPLSVSLLTAPKADVTTLTPVRAELHFEDYHAKRGYWIVQSYVIYPPPNQTSHNISLSLSVCLCLCLSVRSRCSSVKVDNDSQRVDDSGVAVFSDIKFPQGSRLKMVRVRFTVDVQFLRLDGSYDRAVVDSNFTQSFIGMPQVHVVSWVLEI